MPSAKNILITGATDGIGRAAAIALAAMGHRLFIVGRNRERGEAVRRAAVAVAGDGEAVEVLVADLSRMGEVRRLAAEVRERTDRLDVLANNAGALFTSRRVTEDGLDETMALNHFAPFLLTVELMPLLRASGPDVRVITTASSAHKGAALDLDDLQMQRAWTGYTDYCNSKLANILFTSELASRNAGSNVSAHCFHPGFVRTGWGLKDARHVAAAIGLAARLVARSPERGARTLVHLATSPDVAERSGLYWYDERPVTPSGRARDAALARGLWERTETALAAG